MCLNQTDQVTLGQWSKAQISFCFCASCLFSSAVVSLGLIAALVLVCLKPGSTQSDVWKDEGQFLSYKHGVEADLAPAIHLNSCNVWLVHELQAHM